MEARNNIDTTVEAVQKSNEVLKLLTRYSNILPSHLEQKVKDLSQKIESTERATYLSFRNDINKEIKNRGFPPHEKMPVALVKGSESLEKANKDKLIEKTTESIASNKKNLFEGFNRFINTKFVYTNDKSENPTQLKSFIDPDIYNKIREDKILYEVLQANEIPKHGAEIVINTLGEILYSKDYNDFANKVNKLEAKKKIQILNSLAYISNIQLYNREMFAAEKGDILTAYEAANTALKMEINKEQFFETLKQSIDNSQQLDLATCIQIHTFIAQLAEDIGFEATTVTTDIGISHRLAILKDPNTGKMYLISDGLLLEGKNYKQLLETFNKIIQGRTVFRHYVYNSSNEQIATIQTNTQRQVVENINPFDESNIPQFVNQLLQKDNLSAFHRPNDVKITLGNMDKEFAYQHTFDNGLFLGGELTSNDITWEDTNIKNIGGMIGWGNDNIDVRAKVGYQQIDYQTHIDQHIYSSIATTGILNKSYKNVNIGLVGYTDFALTIDSTNKGFAITNAEGNINFGSKLGYQNDKFDSYISFIKNYRIETPTSLSRDTQILKPDIKDTGYNIGGGITYSNNNLEIGADVLYGKGDGKETLYLNGKIVVDNTGFKIEYFKQNHKNSMLPDNEYIKGEVEHRINKNFTLYGGVQENKESNMPDNVQYYAGMKLKF